MNHKPVTPEMLKDFQEKMAQERLKFDEHWISLPIQETVTVDDKWSVAIFPEGTTLIVDLDDKNQRVNIRIRTPKPTDSSANRGGVK
jgi:hypothetical protein